MTFTAGPDHTYYLAGFQRENLFLGYLLSPIQVFVSGWIIALASENDEDAATITRAFFISAAIFGGLITLLYLKRGALSGGPAGLDAGRDAIGEVMGDLRFPIYTYRNFRRQEGLTVEAALGELRRGWTAEMGIQVPDSLIDDCVRLCCTLCLLENDPEIISPDVLADDRAKYEQTGDQRYVEKARRRGKVGWDVGRQLEVIPHYRRPHMALVWTGRGRAVPRVVPRRGSVVHREVVEKVPSGFGEER